MRALFLSDTHIGFRDRNYPERKEDPFLGLEKALEIDSDVILHGGDLFDVPKPFYDDIARTLDIIKKHQKGEEIEVTIESLEGETLNSFKERRPFIAVHGNHDWNLRGGNVYHVLERAGIVYAHRRKVILEGDETLEVVGMGWIPDRYVIKVMEDYRGIEGDLFLFHQPVEGLYPEIYGEKAVPPSLFPKGFRFYLGGHLHWIVDRILEGRRFLIPGSTTITTLKADEITKPRVVYLLEKNNVDRVELKGLRRAYVVEASDFSMAVEKISQIRDSVPPVVKVVGNVEEKQLRDYFRGRALIYVKPVVGEEMRSFKEHISRINIDEEDVFNIFKEKMGDRWEPWMEEFLRGAMEGEEEAMEVIRSLRENKPRTVTDWFSS